MNGFFIYINNIRISFFYLCQVNFLKRIDLGVTSTYSSFECTLMLQEKIIGGNLAFHHFQMNER
jgi:hypothetical protein